MNACSRWARTVSQYLNMMGPGTVFSEAFPIVEQVRETVDKKNTSTITSLPLASHFFQYLQGAIDPALLENRPPHDPMQQVAVIIHF